MTASSSSRAQQVAAGQRDLAAARHLVALLERAHTPRAELERLARLVPWLDRNDQLVSRGLRQVLHGVSAEGALLRLIVAQAAVIEELHRQLGASARFGVEPGMIVPLTPVDVKAIAAAMHRARETLGEIDPVLEAAAVSEILGPRRSVRGVRGESFYPQMLSELERIDEQLRDDHDHQGPSGP